MHALISLWHNDGPLADFTAAARAAGYRVTADYDRINHMPRLARIH
ncbi:hypothetical protein [Chitinilyticum litopenaei]|nr:hypothetical protein [Chitinilyticum litopenaei]